MITEKELLRRKRISETLKRKYKSGEFIQWHKGKTKENHSGLKNVRN